MFSKTDIIFINKWIYRKIYRKNLNTVYSNIIYKKECCTVYFIFEKGLHNVKTVLNQKKNSTSIQTIAHFQNFIIKDDTGCLTYYAIQYH